MSSRSAQNSAPLEHRRVRRTGTFPAPPSGPTSTSSNSAHRLHRRRSHGVILEPLRLKLGSFVARLLESQPTRGMSLGDLYAKALLYSIQNHCTLSPLTFANVLSEGPFFLNGTMVFYDQEHDRLRERRTIDIPNAQAFVDAGLELLQSLATSPSRHVHVTHTEATHLITCGLIDQSIARIKHRNIHLVIAEVESWSGLRPDLIEGLIKDTYVIQNNEVLERKDLVDPRGTSGARSSLGGAEVNTQSSTNV